MKKRLLLLPLCGLFLAGCGDIPVSPTPTVNPGTNADPLDPKLPVGEEIDVTKPEEVENAGQRLAKNLDTSYSLLKSGVEVSGSFKIKNFDVNAGGVKVKCENIGFDFDLKVGNLGSKISDWKIIAELSDFGGKVTVNEQTTFEASNIGLKFYFNNGNLYGDLSNSNLKSLVQTIIEFVAPESSFDMISGYASQLLVKNNFGSIFDIKTIKDVPVLPSFDEEDIFYELGDAVDELDEYQGKFSLVNYEGNGLGVEVNFNNKYNDTIDFDDSIEDYILNANVSANALFDSIGRLQKVYVSESVDETVDVEGMNVVIKGDAELGIAIKYDNISFIMPDFTGWVNFPLFEMLGSYASIVTSFDVAVPLPVPAPIEVK